MIKIKKEEIESHTISLLVDNEAGVLARVIGLFSGRCYNIESLAVAEVDQDHHKSRITIVTNGSPMTISQIKSQLEDGIHVREQNLTAEQQQSIKNFALLTNKPLMVVININEEQSENTPQTFQEINDLISKPLTKATALAAQLEMELTEMEPEDERDFRESLSINESGLDQMVRLTYDLLNLITFFTVGEDENRACPIQTGTMAVNAAGEIHSDIQKGFIRGEVIAFDDLVECNGMTDAKTKGLIRQEGRSYEMKDGDIMHVLFNV